MRLFRASALLALAIVLVTVAAIDAAPTQAGKTKQHAIHGTVVAVHHGKNGKGTMKVAVHTQNGKAGKTGPALAGSGKSQGHIATVHFDSSTRFFKAGGKGKKSGVTQKALHKGEHVIVHGGQHAKVVDILGGTKQKK